MNKHKYDIQDESDSIRASICRISSLLGKTPTQKEYKENSLKEEMSLDQISYRFGKWSDAVEFAGLEPNPSQKPPRGPEITKEELIDEFIKVSNEVGSIPSTHVFRSRSMYSWTPYKTKWGSWRDAVETIVKDHASRFDFAVESTKRKKKKQDRKKLRIDLPLIYEPNNEMETVIVFALLADRFACRLKVVRSEFPDAIIEYEKQDIPVEFEYLSSNYLQHCHPMDFDGLVICWREDVPLHKIKTISLEKVIRELALRGTDCHDYYTAIRNITSV